MKHLVSDCQNDENAESRQKLEPVHKVRKRRSALQRHAASVLDSSLALWQRSVRLLSDTNEGAAFAPEQFETLSGHSTISLLSLSCSVADLDVIKAPLHEGTCSRTTTHPGSCS